MYRKIEKEEINSAVSSISENGFCSIKSFLNEGTIKKLLGLVEREQSRNASKKPRNVPDRDANDKIVYNLQCLDKSFIDLVSSELVSEIAKPFLNDPYYRFLDTELPNYNLTYYNARSSGQQLDLHIDSGIPFKGPSALAMQFVFLLEDSTENNGCTVIVPKSHQSGTYTDRSLDLERLHKLTGKKGDVIIWDSRSWHGSLPNKTGASRWALISTFARWFVKPQMNIAKTINDELYKQCTNAQKHLLGFCSIPPTDPYDRVNTKNGYEFLKNSVDDYEF